jgi:outer membrane protein assembly factor BamB
MMKIFSFFLIFAATLSLYATDWPFWRGLNYDGISLESALNYSNIKKKLWETNVGGGYSAVAVVGKRLYTMGNRNDQDTVFCLDADTGKEIWKYSYSCGKGGSYAGSRATPVVADGLVFTFSNEGLLNCISAKTGKKKWSKSVASEGAKNVKWKYSGSPRLEDGLVIVNAGKSGMAFDQKTGKEVWKSSGIGGYATPVIFKQSGVKYVLLFSKDTLQVVKLKDGKVVTSVPWKTKYDVNASDPIVFGNKIFISSGYDHGCALFEFKNKRLKQIWFNKNLRCQFSTPVLYKGYIYGSDGKTGKGTIVAVSIKDGSEAWREEKAGYGSLIIADNRIIYLTDRGKLIVGKVSPSSFKREISQYVLTKAGKCWTMPVLANKKLYCRGGNGKLICIDMR